MNTAFRRLLTLPKTALVSGAVLMILLVACVLTLPYTLGSVEVTTSAGTAQLPRYAAGDSAFARSEPAWLANSVDVDARGGVMGTDVLGRSLFIRVLAGGGVSLLVGVCAAGLSVVIGTLWGAVAGYVGGKLDDVMMRTVDVLYGLPYVLLVVLLAVASDALVDEYVSRQSERGAVQRALLVERLRADGRPSDERIVRHLLMQSDKEADEAVKDVRARALVAVPPRRLGERPRMVLNLATLLVAIGGVSWLTMARVVRGQVLSLKSQPFVESARALGAGPVHIFRRHLLPNLWGTIIVYATLAVPQAVLQESFLSFLGVGIAPPLPSWGTLASEGLSELNPYRSHWWLLFFPCLMLSVTLLSLNLLGEGLRVALDPRGAVRR